MSTGWIAVGITAYSAWNANNSANKAEDAADAQLAFEQEQYQVSVDYFTGQQAGVDDAYNLGLQTLNHHTHQATASSASASFAQAFMAESYDMEAFMAEAYKVELDAFIETFAQAEQMNHEAMDTFNRRYGLIMDNVKQGILDVSQERLAASGREQLALDAKTLGNNFDQEMAAKGMGRSGITVEMEGRMAMEVAKQARAIDVNSYAQAQGLQAQGIQSLNSMTGIEQDIAGRGEAIQNNLAQGYLNASMQDASLATNVSMQNANNLTQASQVNATNATNVSMTNASNATNVSMTNASNATQTSISNATNATNTSISNAQLASAQQLNIASMYHDKWELGQNAVNSFYSGQPGSGVSSALESQATQYQSDANGYAGVAGSAVESLYENYKPATTTPVNLYGDPLDLF